MSTSNIHLSIGFELADLENGEQFFKASLPKPLWGPRIAHDSAPAFDEDHMLDGELWLRVSATTIPLIASVVLLWLGKGKKVRLRRGKTSNEIELQGYSAGVTKELIERWIVSGIVPSDSSDASKTDVGDAIPTSRQPKVKPTKRRRKNKRESD